MGYSGGLPQTFSLYTDNKAGFQFGSGNQGESKSRFKVKRANRIGASFILSFLSPRILGTGEVISLCGLCALATTYYALP
jgi:hypothetical protein